MNTTDLIKRIESEIRTLGGEVANADGMVRLQEVMQSYDGEYKLVWSDELLKELESRPAEPLHATGIQLIDEVIGGFKEQQLIVIGGDSAHGKSTMGLFLVEQLERLSPVVIPLEQSNEEIISQRKSNGYSIPRFLSPRSLSVKVSVDWIEERIVEGIAKHNTKLVMIDHLGYINNEKDKGENLAYRVGETMRGLKNLAKKWNVIIILLVHISQHDEGKPPSRQDIKNSSDIAQESDMVCFVWRKNKLHKKIRVYENKTLFSIQKNRRTGRNANIGLEFNSETGRYEENNGWVKSMIESAEREIAIEDDYDSYTP